MAPEPDVPILDDSALSGARPPASQKTSARVAVLLVVPLTIVLVAVVLLFYVYYTGTEVDGESMLPNLRPADRVLVTKSYNAPIRGDVVVAHVLEQDGLVHDVIKRLVAVPGDIVQVKDDVVYVNGRQESYPGIVRVPGAGVDVAEFRLEPGQVYLLGDNRPISYDSRFIGPVPLDDIQGEAVGIYAPVTRIGRVR